MNPIFIIGSERSGTNLLRLILDSHSRISIPHPPHIMKEMSPLEKLYGDLSIDRNFIRLIRDTVRFVDLHYYPWRITLDKERVFKEAMDRNLYCIMVSLYEQYMEKQGKQRWGCKSTFMIRYADVVKKYHKPKLLHLVRDGRDVAASAKTSVFSRYHPYYVSKLWSSDQKSAIDLLSRLPEDEIITIRYEDLLEDPEKVVMKICSFIGEEFEEKMLGYFKREHSVDLSGMSESWENLRMPILKGNAGKYRQGLSIAEVTMFERNAVDELLYFGYLTENRVEELKNLKARRISLFLRFWFAASEAGKMTSVELQALISDKNALLRLRRRFFLLYLRVRLLLGRLFLSNRSASSDFRASLKSGN